MKPERIIRGLFVLLFMVPLTGCLTDSGSESGTEVQLRQIDPDEYSCSPLDDGADHVSLNRGIKASLHYLTSDQPAYTDVSDYINYGTHVSNLDIYFNQIFIPTRPFDRGFVTAGGTTIQTLEGDTLYEYFALKMNGRIARANLPKGLYQFALLSDDGSVLNMDFGYGKELVVDNNGQHPTRFGCATTAVELGDSPIPYELLYNQGPKYHIALTLMARPWPADNNPNDIECGRSGNDRYFDSTQDPVTANDAYLGLLDRGWFPLAAENYLLPEEQQENPCAVEAPVISDLAFQSITSNSATVVWATDIEATSQVVYYSTSAPDVIIQTIEDMSARTSHSVVLEGLDSNTEYIIKVVSRSDSGLSSESAEVSIRTRR